MENLNYFTHKYQINLKQNSPIVVPEVGRVELAHLFKELGYKIGAEIGVQRAEYSEVLLNLIPGLELFGIDAWIAYEGYHDILGGQREYDLNYQTAKQKTSLFDCHLIKKWSMDAVKDFKAGSLDFVYIDGNHDFEHCTEDIAHWGKKVKIGGIISGHDFARSNRPRLKIHCKDVVQGWTYAYGIKPWFVLTKDRSPNWMWIKEK
jgi:hypothetical protein